MTLSANGGTLTFDGAGDYILTAIAKDAQGREFSSEPVTIKVITNLSLSLTSDLEKLHEDEAAAISLTVEHGTPSTVAWALTHDGEGVPASCPLTELGPMSSPLLLRMSWGRSTPPPCPWRSVR